MRRLVWNNQVNGAIEKVNLELENYCNSLGIKTLNSSQVLSGNGCSVDKGLQKDCLHLNGKGYAKLNIALNEFLMRNGLKQ